MKLSQWAKQQGISYRTAWNWFKNNHIPNAYQSKTGTIIVHEPVNPKVEKTVIYCRMSSTTRKHELDYQVQRCINYCSQHNIPIHKVFKEVASGMNDKRREFLKMLEYKPSTIIIEHKDRLTRFGFNYLKVLLEQQGCKITVIHNEEEDESDLIKDMISVVTSFCCRLYGLRRGKNKSKRIQEVLNEKEK